MLTFKEIVSLIITIVICAPLLTAIFVIVFELIKRWFTRK